jgi:hypothetical protein
MELWKQVVIAVVILMAIAIGALRAMRTGELSRWLVRAWFGSALVTTGVIIVGTYLARGGAESPSQVVLFLGSLPVAAFFGTHLAIMGRGVCARLPAGTSWWHRAATWSGRAVWGTAVVATLFVFLVFWVHFVLRWL